MSENQPRDVVAVVLLALGLVGGVLELFYRPFGVGPAAVVVTMAAIVISPKYRRLGSATVTVVALCFLIGMSIAVWYSRPLY